LFAEGVEIAIVWLAISLKQGMETATTVTIYGIYFLYEALA
jgi:hypothetical protein